jgi:hypothetical protein
MVQFVFDYLHISLGNLKKCFKSRAAVPLYTLKIWQFIWPDLRVGSEAGSRSGTTLKVGSRSRLRNSGSQHCNRYGTVPKVQWLPVAHL